MDEQQDRAPEPERGTGQREDHRAAPPGHEIPDVKADWQEPAPEQEPDEEKFDEHDPDEDEPGGDVSEEDGTG